MILPSRILCLVAATSVLVASPLAAQEAPKAEQPAAKQEAPAPKGEAPKAEPAKGDAPKAEKAQSVGVFGEAVRGDVPDGTREMLTPEADRAIQNGLAWLARSQQPDGSFGSGTYRGNIAVTSLAGLAFMAGGSSPGRGPYGSQVDKALAYVMANTSPAGFIAVAAASTHGPMYSHGFGALFLAEAYGMTRRAEIREKLQKAVRLIIDTQNHEGGWRYQPVRHDADISVTICEINALRAARNAGLFIPKETVEACIKYVKQAQNPDGGFRYMLQGGASAFPRSAAGVVALQSAGVYDEKEVAEGVAYLKQFMREIKLGSRYSHYFYGHYYAAQAMWIRGGDDWNEWFPAIRNELVHRQSAAGYWNDSICNEYGTAMALIILQMPNNFLPIFQR
ncbi:prenyltransferase/squalene oxidase repeat-containing protein [Paludisphaera mucosa]|uniref:Prenyltransferase/squalene oxidase repeat-containing protein n=1 Tax=Paludisphaera mucosa TaxID=3030827 RepID=A0ABT6FDR5_9BACT|nr:prenyltransferase/squalene oxidase repeat-containing protein [Paludisphaera mucosa]MDG3005533.1 prenyltransferase/squalene oxidase repeat-containing protein [Paludisphaera mucosa]